MTVSTDEPLWVSEKPKYEGERGGFSKDIRKKRPTLKELQEKKYPFPNIDFLKMLDDVLEKGVIELLESK